MDKEYYLGIDGGATKTTFALANDSGEIIKVLKKSSSNPFDIGCEKACEVIRAGINEVLSEFNIDKSMVNVFAGISGGTSGNNKDIIADYFKNSGFKTFRNGSDLESIVSAGLPDGNGVAVIMGTGSSAFIKVGNELKRLGGYGYLFSAGGCGYGLGSSAIRSALMSEDGSGEQTIIRDLILNETKHKTVLEDLQYFYDIGKKGVASFAPIVITAFKKGDKVAKKIIVENMQQVANLIFRGGNLIKNEKKIKVILVGGLTNEIDLLMPFIKEELSKFKSDREYEINVFDGDVVKGALTVAGLKKEIKYA